MIKNKIKNLNKEQVKRKNFLNKEIKKLILRSIIQNLNVKPNLRSLAFKKLTKLKIKSFLSKQNNNLCLKSGRAKGVLKLSQLSRHEIKKLCLMGSFQNVKIASW